MPKKPASPNPASLPLRNFDVTGPNRSGEITISVQTVINGKPQRLAIQAKRPLLNALSETSIERVKDALYALFSFYQQQHFNAYVSKATGDHTPSSKNARTTARVLFPLLLSWARKPGQKNTKFYKTVSEALRKEGHATVTPARIAAYIIRKNSENRYGQWPGKDPCVDPDKFHRQLKKRKPLWSGIFYTSPSKAYVALCPHGAMRDRKNGIDFPHARLTSFVQAVLDGDSVVMSYQAGTFLPTRF